MATTFILAPDEIHVLVGELIRKYYPDFDSAAAKADILLAYADPDGDQPAIVKDGHRLLGQTSSIKLKDRVKGMGDFEIILDGDRWNGLADPEKAALLDHELHSLEVKRDKKGDFIFDDLQRPTFKKRIFDRQFGWFDAIAARHRKDSVEIQQLKRLFEEAGQVYLPFVKEAEDDKILRFRRVTHAPANEEGAE